MKRARFRLECARGVRVFALAAVLVACSSVKASHADATNHAGKFLGNWTRLTPSTLECLPGLVNAPPCPAPTMGWEGIASIQVATDASMTLVDVHGRHCTGRLVRVGAFETFRAGSCDETVNNGVRLSPAELDGARIWVYNDCLQEADRGVNDAITLYYGRPGACAIHPTKRTSHG